jgi:hypothetical protein
VKLAGFNVKVVVDVDDKSDVVLVNAERTSEPDVNGPANATPEAPSVSAAARAELLRSGVMKCAPYGSDYRPPPSKDHARIVKIEFILLIYNGKKILSLIEVSNVNYRFV